MKTKIYYVIGLTASFTSLLLFQLFQQDKDIKRIVLVEAESARVEAENIRRKNLSPEEKREEDTKCDVAAISDPGSWTKRVKGPTTVKIHFSMEQPWREYPDSTNVVATGNAIAFTFKGKRVIESSCEYEFFNKEFGGECVSPLLMTDYEKKIFSKAVPISGVSNGGPPIKE